MATGNPRRNKVALKPGHSQVHWMMKVQGSAEGELAGRKGQRPRRSIPMSEVQQHASLDDAWTVYRGRVFNITSYLDFHPGGVPIIMSGAGKDMTELFQKHHSWVNFESMVGALYLGDLERGTLAAAAEEDEDEDEDEDEGGHFEAKHSEGKESEGKESEGKE